jgi:hypothetical protein
MRIEIAVPCRPAILFLCVLLSFLSLNCCLAQGTWTALSSQAPNKNYGVMLLLTDGRVLVKSDWDAPFSFSCTCPGDPGNTWNMLTPDSHGSYINGTWTTVAPMADTRVFFASQVLRDGRVYVAGGEYGSGGTKAEIYNPLTNVWTPVSVLAGDTIFDGNSQLLPDGRVLQAIAYNPVNRTCIFDPATNTFSHGPTVIGMHSESAWLLLKDNSILFADRVGGTSERYIPATGNWIYDASPALPLYDWAAAETGSAQLLPDGRGVFFGGSGNVLYYSPTGTSAPGAWTAGPHMPASLGAPDGPSAMMANGKILCSLSDTNLAATWFLAPTYFYEFDYLLGTWTQLHAPIGGDTLNGPSAGNDMLILPDASVLFSNAGSTQYYVYTPSGSLLPSGKPTVDTVIKISCTKYMASGKLFNGISQGACYNDELQNPTNYPLVRLTHGANVYYARSYNWNSTGVMRGSAADTTYFDLPTGLPGGTYGLEVVANGNPSAMRTFNTCGHEGLTAIDSQISGIHITPNPAISVASVTFDANAGAYSIAITDVTGRTLLCEEGTAIAGQNSHILNISGLASGLYTVTVRATDAVRNTKLVLVR